MNMPKRDDPRIGQAELWLSTIVPMTVQQVMLASGFTEGEAASKALPSNLLVKDHFVF